MEKTSMQRQEILDKTFANYIELPAGLIVVGCGDGRHPVEEGLDPYAKKFGGRFGFTWDKMVLDELANPSSMQQTIIEYDRLVEPMLERADIEAQVHSDEHAEGHDAKQIALSQIEGSSGCGRMQRAEQIAIAMLENVESIITEMKELAPDLVSGREDRIRQIASVNSELAQRRLPDGRQVLPTGRELMLGIIDNGAQGTVLAGEHEEEDGAVYNLRPGTTNDVYKSQRQFGADGWASIRFYKANEQSFGAGISEEDVLLQDIAVSLATKLVLTGDMNKVAVRS